MDSSTDCPHIIIFPSCTVFASQVHFFTDLFCNQLHDHCDGHFCVWRIVAINILQLALPHLLCLSQYHSNLMLLLLLALFIVIPVVGESQALYIVKGYEKHLLGVAIIVSWVIFGYAVTFCINEGTVKLF